MYLNRSLRWQILAPVILATVVACGKTHPERPEIVRQDCEASLPGTGNVHKVPDLGKPNSCYGVLLMCNYCEYDASGQFRRSGMEPCGACMGSPYN